VRVDERRRKDVLDREHRSAGRAGAVAESPEQIEKVFSRSRLTRLSA
jgi:hypothetical protein